MSELFKDQSLLSITCETGFDSLDDAEITLIKYRKPSGEVGSWTASINGTDLIYSFVDGDIDEVGTWQFQAYFEIGGLKAFGALKSKLFQKSLMNEES